jgi:hypothetical protein
MTEPDDLRELLLVAYERTRDAMDGALDAADAVERDSDQPTWLLRAIAATIGAWLTFDQDQRQLDAWSRN